MILLVRDLMTPDPISLRETDDLATAYDLMVERHVRHMPIVDDAGDLIGLVTHRDLVRSVLHSESDLPLSNERQLLRAMKVDQIMLTEVETTAQDAPLREAAQIMLENKFGCLPVVDNERLIGIITEADFVRHVLDSLEE
jgi:CBS domain-containing membrane protein